MKSSTAYRSWSEETAELWVIPLIPGFECNIFRLPSSKMCAVFRIECWSRGWLLDSMCCSRSRATSKNVTMTSARRPKLKQRSILGGHLSVQALRQRWRKVPFPGTESKKQSSCEPCSARIPEGPSNPRVVCSLFSASKLETMCAVFLIECWLHAWLLDYLIFVNYATAKFK